MDYRAIFFDLDGTVLDSDFRMTSGAKRAFHRLADRGYKVAIATGRSYVSALPYIEEIGCVSGRVFSNGAVVENPLTKKIEILCPIQPEQASLAAERLMEAGFTFKLQTLDGVMHGFGSGMWPVHDDFLRNERFCEALKTEPALKLIILCEDQGGSSCLERLENVLDCAALRLRLFKSAAFSMECVHEKVSKWEGIKRLLHSWQISQEQVITVGDHENDYEMIESAGFGVSVEPGSARNHSVSKLQIPAPEKGGIEFLSDYLLRTF